MIKINKYTLKCDFFDVITSNYDPFKSFFEDKHSICIRIDDNSIKYWNYDSISERDEDFNVLLNCKLLLR